MQKLWIVNPQTLEKCSDGEIGEIWVQDPSVAQGYWQKPEITKEIFHAYEKTTNEGPFLRTGDLGFIHEGQLYIAGRNKDLIIINGRNIYPQDIEHLVEQEYPELRKNCSAAFSCEIDGHEELVLVCEIADQRAAEELVGKIKNLIATNFEVEIYDIVLIKKGTSSKTTSGKIQRQLSKKIYLEESSQIIASSRSGNSPTKKRDIIQPNSSLEKQILDYFAEILQLPKTEISTNDTFIELGGNSIKAQQILGKIADELHFDVTLKKFFANPTIVDLARLISTNELSDSIIIPVNNRKKRLLSYNQERLWFLDQYGKKTRYNLPVFIDIAYNVDPIILKKALRILAEQQDVLRSAIIQDNKSLITQLTPANKIDLDFENYTNLDKHEISEIIEKDLSKAFNLKQPPLFRTKLFVHSNKSSRIYFNFHHIITDGWSINLFCQELGEIYEALINKKKPKEPNLRIQYNDYSLWERDLVQNETYQDKLDFWRNELQGGNFALELPSDMQRPSTPTGAGEIISKILDKNTVQNLKNLATESNVTMFTIFNLAVYLLLNRYSAQNDIVIGIPVINRKTSELKKIQGFFANTIPLRIKSEGYKQVKELLEYINQKIITTLDYQDVPFEHIVNIVQPERDLSSSPLFQVMLAYNNFALAEFNLDNIKGTVTEIKQHTSQFDLSFSFDAYQEAENIIELHLEYNSDIFKEDTINRIIKHFEHITSILADSFEVKLEELDLIPHDEKQLILENWNDTDKIFAEQTSFLNLLANQVKTRPNHIAIQNKNQLFSYSELANKSDKFAQQLLKQNVQKGDVIAIALERSIELIWAVIAIMKTGATYLPIDKRYPLVRIKYMLADSNTKFVILDDEKRDDYQKIFSSDKLISIEEQQDTSDIISLPEIKPDDLAYIMYTSGTTGKPKGVMIRHSSLANYVNTACEIYKISPLDIVSQAANFSFDIFVEEVFPTLAAGAKITIMANDTLLNNAEFHNFITNQNPTIMSLSTALWHSLAEQDFHKSIKRIIIGGEAVNQYKLKKWFEKNDIEIFNTYGPTETTVICSFDIAKDAEKPVTLGKAIANYKIYILNAKQKLQPIGVPGEICISGEGVAAGYLNQEALTQDNFIPDPFKDRNILYRSGDLGRYLPDGNVEYLGRIDNQVKIRGFRIEIDEIENLLNQHPDIVDSKIIAKDNQISKQLVCFYTGIEEINPKFLQKFLLQKLPNYMVPALFIKLNKLPLTINGKVDLKALEEVKFTLPKDPSNQQAETKKEIILKAIWEEVLGIPNIGINDNYFEIGGDSIKSIFIVSGAKKKNLHFCINDLFNFPTIKKLADNVYFRNPSHDLVIDQNITQGKLSPIQLWFFQNQKFNLNHWNQSMILTVKNGLNIDRLQTAISKICEFHTSFKLRFKQEGKTWQQFYVSKSDINLEIIDLTDSTLSIEEECLNIEKSLNVFSGPTARFIYFKTKNANYFFIAAHHLIIDGVSWRILLQDLDSLLHGDNNLVDTTSYISWSNELHNYAAKIAQKPELYWEKLNKKLDDNVPQLIETSHQIKDTEILQIQLKSNFNSLIKLSECLKSSIMEIFLAAFYRNYCKVFKQEKLQLDLEGHGRDQIAEYIDISRTIGWFTTLYPTVLYSDNIDDERSLIKDVSFLLNQIPKKGFNYNIHKYINKNLPKLRNSQVLFDYLGEFNFESDFFKFYKTDYENFYSRESSHLYALELHIMIVEKKINILCRFDTQAISKKQIKSFFEKYDAFLTKFLIKENQ